MSHMRRYLCLFFRFKFHSNQHINARNHDVQVQTSEDAELIRKQRFGLFIALALAREQYELWERMQVCAG